MSIQTVGRYEIIGELGRGAMGVVYKAQDPTIGRTVALKTMRLDVHGLENDDVLRRFKNEARAAGLLNHPNIVTIYDAGEQDGMFYIAMEFIEGTTLQQILLERRILPPEEAIQISREVCKALDYAHANGIIHRDIKPANIMITPTGAVKIMDFGIAKAGGGMTSTGQVLGTPNYMSPEQVKGKPLDGRSDLFSFGVVLYEMITGEKPFVGQNVTTVIYKIVHENPIAPRDLDATIHAGLSQVVTKSLAKLPDERYQSGAELSKDLGNYKSVGSTLNPTTAVPVSTVNLAEPTRVVSPTATGVFVAAAPAAAETTGALQQVAPPARKRFWEIALISLLLVALALGGYGYYRYRNALTVEKADKELEQKLKEQQIQEAAAARKAAEIAAQQQANAAPVPAPPAEPERKPTPKPAVSPNAVTKNRGELRFDSQPRGAKVEVDGWTEPTWITPFKASNLGAGNHTVIFSKTGYLPETRTASVEVGKSSPLTVQLNPVARLVVNSTPQGASVEVDGQETGMITPAEIVLEKGDHTVLLRRAGFKDISATHLLTEGETWNFSPVLLQPTTEMKSSNRPFWKKMLPNPFETIPDGKGMVHIHSEPEGATILVGDQIAPRKTNVMWPVDPGTYEIVLRMDGYKPVHRTVRVVKGRDVYVDERLEKR